MSDTTILEEMKKIWLLKLVVELGSFQKAALQAKLTRSAVSQAVTHLEKYFGTPLLIREKGRIKQTLPCSIILAKVDPALTLLKSMDVKPKRPLPISSLDLGASESVAIEIMGALIDRVRGDVPTIKIAVKSYRSGKLCSMVRRGELRTAIVTQSQNMNGLTVTPLAEDRLGFYISSSLPVAERQWESVFARGFGTISAESDGRPSYYVRLFRALKEIKHVSFLSDSYEVLLAAACHGSILALLPTRVAARRMDELTEVVPPRTRKSGFRSSSNMLGKSDQM